MRFLVFAAAAPAIITVSILTSSHIGYSSDSTPGYASDGAYLARLGDAQQLEVTTENQSAYAFENTLVCGIGFELYGAIIDNRLFTDPNEDSRWVRTEADERDPRYEHRRCIEALVRSRE